MANKYHIANTQECCDNIYIFPWLRCLYELVDEFGKKVFTEYAFWHKFCIILAQKDYNECSTHFVFNVIDEVDFNQFELKCLSSSEGLDFSAEAVFLKGVQ